MDIFVKYIHFWILIRPLAIVNYIVDKGPWWSPLSNFMKGWSLCIPNYIGITTQNYYTELLNPRQNAIDLTPLYLGEWLEYHRPMLHMYSKLTEWNNFGLLTERIGLVLVYKVLEDWLKISSRILCLVDFWMIVEGAKDAIMRGQTHIFSNQEKMSW